MTRTLLLLATTYYVTPFGVDDWSRGCTRTQPCQTIQFAMDAVKSNVDLGGYSVVFDACGLGDVTYDSGAILLGPFVGQTDASQVIIRGNVTHPEACVIQPTSNYCFGASFMVAAVTISGFKCDQSLNSQDSVVVGWGASMWIDHFVFGDNLNPFNDVSAYGGGTTVIFSGPYKVAKTPPVVTNAQFQSDSQLLLVDSCDGIKPGMIPFGYGMPISNVVVQWCQNNTVLLNDFTIAAGDLPTSFGYGGNAHIVASLGATIFYNTNCGQSPIIVETEGQPTYYAAWLYLLDGGRANLGASYQGTNAVGRKFYVETNSILNGCGAADTIPGNQDGIVRTGGIVY
jgi:hypothetical protein